VGQVNRIARRAVWIGIASTVLLASSPQLCKAQETRGSEFPDLDEQPGVLDYVKARLTLAERYVGNTDFGAYSATSHQPEGRLRVTVPVSKNAALRLMGGGRALLYDFEGPTDFFEPGPLPERPFGNLYSWEFRVQSAYLFSEDQTLFFDDERWLLLLQVGTKSGWESGAEMKDGLRIGGSVAVGYQLSDRLELAAGISIGSRLLKDGVRVSPLIEFDWRISDKWRLRSYGIGLQLEYALIEDLLVFTRARFESNSYRLDERPGVVGSGSLQVRQAPVGLGVQWRPWRFLRLRFIGGVVAYNRLRVKDEDDNTLAKRRSDTAPYFALRVDLSY